MNARALRALVLFGALIPGVVSVALADSPKMKMTTPIPESISTPDKVETSIGTFEYFDGVPTHQTAPGKAFFVCLRMYGPTEPWIEGVWRPSNVDLVK